ncbi:lipid kinase [soil metagenome]
MLVITNAGAGDAEAGAEAPALAVLGEAAELDAVATANLADIERALGDHDGRPVVVMGGDGTLHAVVSVLHARGLLADTPVALVPLGTGNDFARGLGIPLDSTEAARQLLSVRPRRLDLVVDDQGGVVVNAVHVGVGVEAAEEAHHLKPRYGRFGYVLGAVRTGFVTPGQHLRVVVDGQVVADGRTRVLQVAIGNGRFVAGGVPLLPAAVADDGRVDVVVSFALSTVRRFAYAVGAQLGRHPHHRDVVPRRGRHVLVEARRGFRWNVDGEVKGPELRREWWVQPQAWTVLAPPADR